MSEQITEAATVTASPEARTWARQIIEQYRAVEALHTPVPRYSFEGSDLSWETFEEARDSGWQPDDAEVFDTERAVITFLVCAECGRLELNAYEQSMWPCATARALGNDR